jgi:hypothetical protein
VDTAGQLPTWTFRDLFEELGIAPGESRNRRGKGLALVGFGHQRVAFFHHRFAFALLDLQAYVSRLADSYSYVHLLMGAAGHSRSERVRHS